MKNHSDNSNKPNLSEDQPNVQQLNELDNDAVWSLLDDADKRSPVKASPMFARNVMREIRLSAEQPSKPFLQQLFGTRFNKAIFALSATAACTLLAVTMISDQKSEVAPVTAYTDFLDDLVADISIDELAYNEKEASSDTTIDIFAEEMLELANQDPFFISEEEIKDAMQM